MGFYDQSWQTQQDFLYVYGGGSDWGAAERAWENENKGNSGGGGGSSSSSGSSSSGSSGSSDADAVRKAGSEQAGVQAEQKKAELRQAQKQFEASLAFKMKQLKLDKQRVAIEKGTAFADAWYKQQQVRIADQAHQVALGQLGLDYFTQDVKLRSTPRNWAQQADFEAGASSRQDVPVFLQNLAAGVANRPYGPLGAPTQSGSAGDAFAALGGGAPPAYAGGGGGVTAPWSPPNGGAFGGFSNVPDQYQAAQGSIVAPSSAVSSQSAGVLPGEASGADPRQQAAMAMIAANPPSNTQGWNVQDVALLQAIAKQYQQGPQSIAPGAWESLPTDQKDIFLGGVERLGGSARSYEEGLARSRPGQGGTMVA